MLVTVNIQSPRENTPAKHSVITLHPTVVKKYKLPLSSLVTLRFGSRETQVTILSGHHHQKLMHVSQFVASQLLLSEGTLLQFNYQADRKKLELGPIFAILLDAVKPESSRPLGAMSDFCREVIQAAKRRGFVAFAMAPESLRMEENMAFGWTWRNGAWKERSYPLPHVVYNRISSRSREADIALQELLSSAQKKSGWHFFNASFLNKWQVYQLLHKQGIPCHIPVTEPFRDEEQLKRWINKYPVLFVKPMNGSLGRGIYRIQRLSKGYGCANSALSHTTVKRFASLGSLIHYLAPRLKEKSYLIQQGIPIAKLEHQPMDFRVLVQRGRLGRWVVTSCVARQAHRRTFVSNLAQGGNLYSPREALTRIGVTSPSATLRRLRTVSLNIAVLLSQQLESHYAEFGVDLAVDVHGRVWLLEVNTKPSKNEDTLLSNSSTRPSIKHMLSYVAHVWRKSR